MHKMMTLVSAVPWKTRSVYPLHTYVQNVLTSTVSKHCFAEKHTFIFSSVVNLVHLQRTQ